VPYGCLMGALWVPYGCLMGALWVPYGMDAKGSSAT
jgi:hypothetical protein